MHDRFDFCSVKVHPCERIRIVFILYDGSVGIRVNHIEHIRAKSHRFSAVGSPSVSVNDVIHCVIGIVFGAKRRGIGMIFFDAYTDHAYVLKIRTFNRTTDAFVSVRLFVVLFHFFPSLYKRARQAESKVSPHNSVLYTRIVTAELRDSKYL